MINFRDLEIQLKMMSGNVFNMILFDKLKTGNPILDAILTTIILSSITFFFQYLNNYLFDFIEYVENMDFDYKNWFKIKNIVEYEGKISLSTNYYDSKLNQTNSFSDRFKALWFYIIENVGDNESIKNIKEFSFENPSNYNDLCNKRDLGIYMVTQKERFVISEKLEIFAYTTITSEIQEQDNKNNNRKESKSSNKIEKITIELFSYKSNVNTIKNFVEDLTHKYLSSIEDIRVNKKFIYTLSQLKYENHKCEMWDEVQFLSTRTFTNIFFEGKENIVKKLDFFLNNKDWFFNKGIPYSLGIGMHGPPGTGKTSLIKAIGNYTNRHIIVISLKLIKTKKQLDSVFFEERYNIDNKKDSIGFDKKIIVFEDIDCIGDIVMDREKKKNKSTTGFGKKLNFDELSSTSKINVGDLLETIVATEKATEKLCEFPKGPIDEEPITLDDILNLWDGIRETPGRIMVISSNHYYDLDPALIRPGRIDITLELSFASRQIIKEIYNHLFGDEIDNDKLNLINDNYYSPAEIINIYMNSDNNKEKFIERLIKNEHI
jgi:ATP-dependent 26S proteasome regulatory subunit